MDSQWLFPLSALYNTPSSDSSSISLEQELRERAKGVEFIYRVAAQLALTNAVFCAAAQYFHRFYMRYSMEDYPRQEVAAASVFLATKTEENSRKLNHVSMVCYSKATGQSDENSPEIQRWQKNILATEEVLLDALCFDFIVDHPQAELVDLLAAFNAGETLEQYSWTIVHDSLRTPLCILQPARIIATASFILAQRMEEGPDSASLDERIFSRSSASLPTPPHMHPRSPPSASFAQGFFHLSDSEMEAVAITVSIILDFYTIQSQDENKDYLRPIVDIAHPSLPPLYKKIYTIDSRPSQTNDHVNGAAASPNDGGITPASMGRTPHRSGWTPAPDKPPSPVHADGTSTPLCEPSAQPEKNSEVKAPRRAPPLDLS
ncbi:cyclin-like protein [Ramaria rubella]|nr:cyclin-like protein [Ramaria rubella]